NANRRREADDFLPGGDVPQLDFACLERARKQFAGRGCQQPAIGTERDAQYPVRMPLQAAHLTPGLGVPDPDFTRLARRRDRVPPRCREPAGGAHPEPFRLVVDLQPLLARARVPQANGAIAGARREPAVGTELKGADRVRVAPQDTGTRTGVDVPEAHAL